MEMLSQLAPLEGGEETTAAENEGQPGGDGSIWGRAAIDRAFAGDVAYIRELEACGVPKNMRVAREVFNCPEDHGMCIDACPRHPTTGTPLNGKPPAVVARDGGGGGGGGRRYVLRLNAHVDGPRGTPYFGGRFEVAIVFPAGCPAPCPFQPPAVFFTTPVHHPSVAASTGRVFIPTLGQWWSAAFTTRTVLASLRGEGLEVPFTRNPPLQPVGPWSNVRRVPAAAHTRVGGSLGSASLRSPSLPHSHAQSAAACDADSLPGRRPRHVPRHGADVGDRARAILHASAAPRRRVRWGAAGQRRRLPPAAHGVRLRARCTAATGPRAALLLLQGVQWQAERDRNTASRHRR